MGSYRIEQIDKNKNESVDFNIYQTVKQLTSQEYFTVGANITDNVIATGGMTGSGAIKSPKKKIGAAPAKSEPPTLHIIIKNLWYLFNRSRRYIYSRLFTNKTS